MSEKPTVWLLFGAPRDEDTREEDSLTLSHFLSAHSTEWGMREAMDEHAIANPPLRRFRYRKVTVEQ